MSKKVRLDVLVHSLGLCESRERARAVIMAGQVYIDNIKHDKAGDMVPEDCTPEIRGETLHYVSRGGLKLEKAMREFPIELGGRVCMDIGASTGGFTDCMLQNGAAKVYSVDVGYGQLAWKLRGDERVVNMERTNIRYVTEENIGEEIDFASIDVSFISLALVLPVAYFVFVMLRARTGKPIGLSGELYPYPFLNYPALGARRFWRCVAGILTGFFLLGLLFVRIGGLLGGRME